MDALEIQAVHTGETPRSFIRLATDLLPSLFHLMVHGLWLRKYPHVDTLGLWFDIDPSSVVRIVYKILPELWHYFQNQITWPNRQEWNNLMGNWPEFPNAVGAIDATPHEIYRPLSEPQRPFYSGHRHYHCMNTQIVIDNEGHTDFCKPVS